MRAWKNRWGEEETQGGKRKHASISQTKEFVLEIDDALLQLFETEFIRPF